MTHLVAVDYNAGKALFNVRNIAVVVDINNIDVIGRYGMRRALTAGAWIKVSPDFKYPDVWRELAEASHTSLEIREKKQKTSERKFRVPQAVKDEAAEALVWANGFERGGTVISLKMAKEIVNSTYLPVSKIGRMAKFFARRPASLSDSDGWSPGTSGFPSDERIRYSLWGGDAAREWTTKVATKHNIITAAGAPTPEEVLEQNQNVDGNEPHQFLDDPEIPGACLHCGRDPEHEIHGVSAGGFNYDDECDYFGRGVNPDTTEVTDLYIRRENGTWAHRANNDWEDIEEPSDDVILIMLDRESARRLADILDRGDEDLPYELSMINPHEAALFSAAVPELDFELIDRVFDIYDSQERSVNAKKQVRGPGGKFVDVPDKPKETAGEDSTQTVKARLPHSVDLVPDVNARIDEYLAEVELQREQSGSPGTLEDGFEEEFAEGGTGQVTDVRPLYLAIVDSIDTDAVLDIVSLVPPEPGTQSDVVAWKRDAGEWVQAPELLAQLRGVTPPPVVELTDDNLLQQVLDQVDEATSGDSDSPEPVEESAPKPSSSETPVNDDGSSGPKPDANPDQQRRAASNDDFSKMSEEKRKKLARKGYALPDGSYAIEDVSQLREAINAFQSEKHKESVQTHILIRAKALNRLDLVPDTWDKSVTDNSYQLWGPHGELISLVAEGGADRNRGNAERLRRYWVRGEGALKIKWNTPGDWYRCVSHLSKYLGVRAKGYCTLRHKEATGFWPGQQENKEKK